MRHEIHTKIKKGQFDSVYVLYGTESYFLEESLHTLLRYGLTNEEREFNLMVYDLDEHSLEECIEDASTPPFFGDRKIIVLKKPLFLTGQKEKIAQNTSVLLEYLKNPSPFSIVVLYINVEKLDERKKITKELKKAATVIQCNELDMQGVLKWIREQGKHHKVLLEEGAIQHLYHLVGNNMMIMGQEIEKLALYVGEGGVVTIEIVSALVAKSVEHNVFTLVEKTLDGNIKEALEVLKELLTRQEEPIKILALFASQFRLLYGVRELMDIGYGQNQIAGHLGVHPYRVKLAMGQAKRYSRDYLKKVLVELAEADYGMKSGKLDKRMLLELFILKRGRN